MTTPTNLQLILNTTGAPALALKRGAKNKVSAKAGQRYRVVNEEGDNSANAAAAPDVAASRQGADLLLSYADGTQLVLQNFYEACKAEQCAVDMPGPQGTGASGGYVITGDSPAGASLSDGGKLVYAFGDTPSLAALTQGAEQARGFTHQHSLSTYIPPGDGLGMLLPLAVGAAVWPQSAAHVAVATVIQGSVVAGPVVTGNGLTAVAYKADGSVLASSRVNADGSFTLNVGNDYTGPVLVKVSDTNADADYFDEATGAAKDLTTDLRALTVIPAAGTYTVSVNVLTELAVRTLGLNGGDGGQSNTSFSSLSQTQITQANQQVAAAVGLSQDLVLGAPAVAIITTDGSNNTQANDYGRLLAALSGAEVGNSTDAVLSDLTATLQSNLPQSTAQVLERLLEGAAKVTQTNLVVAVSDITNQKTTAVTIDTVSTDNRLSPAEMVAGVAVQGTASAGASVTITWSDASGAAQATGSRSVTADSQGHWSSSFSAAEMPALGATTLKATVGTETATRSIYLDEPAAPTITLTQAPGVGGLAQNGHVEVSGVLSGASYDYSTDGGITWTAGSGSGFTVTGDGAKQVLVRQNIGGHFSASSNAIGFTLDATAPSAPSLALATDSGISNTDGISNSGVVNVTGLETGATWQYSTDGGATWSEGSGSSFTLAAGTYAQGAVQVRQSDAAGNTSTAASNSATISIDATAPSAPSLALATDSGISNTDGISNSGVVNVTGLETGATWEYSINRGRTWSTGSGTSFVLPPANTVFAGPDVQVRQSDAAGNTSRAAVNGSSSYYYDATAPSAPSLALATDSGSSNTDGISNSGVVNVTGLETGATWQYSTDGGATWSEGSGSSFTLAAGTYAQGAVQVRQSDVAGNTSTAAASSTAIAVDATEPTVTITTSANALSTNATATLTFTLSEAIAGFSDANVTVTGGTLSNFSGSGTTYTATFTPDAGLSGAATVSVASNTLTDAAGNSNSAASNTLSLVVDAVAPRVSSITSSQTALIVGQTATLSIDLSEASTTFALADLQAVGGTLSDLQGSGSSYSVTFTPDDNRTEPGSVSVTPRSFSDAAGNDNQRSDQDGVVMAISTVRPTATLHARQSQLGVGDVTTIDITLSEAASNFTVDDLSASHGTLSDFTPLGDGVHYSVIFTPEAPYTGTGGVTLANGKFTNAAGNSNSNGADPASTGDLAIDTTPPTVTITSDVSALAIGQSAVITFTFNKDPGASFDASDIAVNGGTLSNLVNHTGTVWSARFTPTDGSTGQASISVAAGRYTDAAGNSGAAGAAPAITIDTQGPVADLFPGNATTVLPGKDLVLNFSESVVKGTGSIVLVDHGNPNNTPTSPTRLTLAMDDPAVVLSNGGKTLTIALPANTLVAGEQYHVEASPGSLLDAAGNAWAGIASSSTWAGSSWHFTAATPSVSLNKIAGDNVVNGSENTAGVLISGTIESNTAGMVAAFVASDFTIELIDPVTKAAISSAKASSYDPATGAWSLSLGPTALSDGQTYDVSVSVAGSTGAAASATASTTGQVLVDLSAAAPTLALTTDTGTSSSDGISANASISVSGLEDGARWEYSTDNGSKWQAGSGDRFEGASTDGVHTVLVRQTDAAGNTSTPASLTFTRDTGADRPVISAVATDNIINATETGSTLTGTAEAGASVTLVLGSGTQARNVSATADGSGNWSHTLDSADLAALGSGQTQVTAVQTDKAGNESFTTLHNLTVDTAAPTVTITSNKTNLMAGETATLSFALSEASSDFTAGDITVSGGTLSNFAGSGRSYSATFTPTAASTATASVSVAAGAFTDSAGNGVQASDALSLSVDTELPTVAITSSASTLGRGQVATLTFTLSEASDSFGADSVTVVGGTLGALSANAARTVYTGVFTPDPTFFGAGSVSVANGAVRDRGNNTNADGADANNTVALTIEAAPTTLAISSDKTALKAGETALLTFTFSSAPTGFAEGDIQVTGGTLGALSAVSATRYVATFTPQANTASGTASVTVMDGSYTGQGSAPGSGAHLDGGMVLDTRAPALLTLNPEDNGHIAANATQLVATFSEAVFIGTGKLQLLNTTDNTTQTYAIDGPEVVISGDTLTLTPTTALVAGKNYAIQMDSTALVDGAGNAYAGIANSTSWNFAATNLSTTLAPVTGDNYINADEKAATVLITGTLTSVNPEVLAALVAGDIKVSVTVPRNGGWNDRSDKVVNCTNVTYDSVTGVWTAQVPTSWVYDDAISDYSVATLINGDTDTVKVTVTGRSGTAAVGLSTTLTETFKVDSSAPASPTLTLAGDTGSSNSDEITRNGLINVGALEAGASWKYSLDGGVNWQDGAGSSFAVVQDGATTVQVLQADAAGNLSAVRSLAFTLDTTAQAPVIDAVTGDNAINASETTAAITGTAEAGASISLSLGGNNRSVTANGSGVWSYTLQAADLTAMGQGSEVISATQTDKAGNVSGAGTAVIQLDTAAPTVTLANTGAASLLAGQQTTITATLSEAIPGFSGSQITVTGGTLGELTVDASGLVYTGTFTPDEGRTTAASLQVASGALRDAAGNANSAASNSLSVTVNTVRPTVAVSSNVAAGSTLHAGDTATITFTLSESSTDFSASDVTTTGGTLSNFSGSGTSYAATFTPDANSTAPGSVSVANSAFTSAGNANADGGEADNTVTFRIATARPTVSISSDVGTLAGGQSALITFAFSEDPGSSFAWDGTAGDIAVTGGTLSAIKGAGTRYTAWFTPTARFAGAASITVADGSYSNTAGSLGQAGASPALTIDAVGPTVAISRSGSGSLGAGQSETITFDFSEAPGNSFTLEDIDVSGGTLGALSAVSATRYVATFTPQANTTGTANIGIASARFGDAAGNSNTDGSDPNNQLAIAYATGSGNSSSGPLAAPTLSLAADTGTSSSDGITRSGVINVAGLVVGATWEYSLDGGKTWKSGSGSSFNLPGANTYPNIEVRQSVAGATSDAGEMGVVVYQPVYSGTVSMALVRDTGASDTDGITYDGRVRVSGLASTDTWRYSTNLGFSWSAATSDSIIPDLGLVGTDTQKYLMVEAKDLAGNTTQVQYSFRLDKLNPAAPNAKLTDDPTDGGAIVAATNIEAGGSVEYRLGAASTWGPTYTAPTAPGDYFLQVKHQDVAGNGNVTGLNFTIAATGPSAPTAVELSDIAAGSGGFVINGEASEDGSGSGASVAIAGDVNGDGLADLIVGAPYSNGSAGRSYVVYGKTGTSGIDLSAVAAGSGGFVINGQVSGDESGGSVARAGDVNGDGLADLIVGANNSKGSAGRSYVVYGKTGASGIDLSAVAAGSGGFVINGQVYGDSSGISVSSAGDVNGDGLTDLIVGALLSDPASGTDAGRSYVVFGKTNATAIDLSAVAAGVGGFVINGQCAGDDSGLSVSSAGDVNGDGLADVIVGAPLSDPAAGESAGRSYVVFGKTNATAIDLSAVAAGSGGFVINGQGASDSSGISVSSAGDVNGDGLADLIVGAHLSDPATGRDAGRSYVVFGKTSSSGIELSDVAAGVNGFVINGQGMEDASGYSVSSVGDFNGDGLADVIVGAPFSNAYAGRSYLVFGKNTGREINLSAVAAGSGGFLINGQGTGNEGDGLGGWSVTGSGDVNGDGLADLIVGAPYSLNMAGRSYVIFGNTAGVVGTGFGRISGLLSSGNPTRMGTDGDDTLSDGSSMMTLLGGAGNDSLSANASSVLYGGAGNDSFTIGYNMATALQMSLGSSGYNTSRLSRIDGGSGIDTLVLAANTKLDLTKVSSVAAGDPEGSDRIASIERIDLSAAGSGLTLATADIAQLAGFNSFNSGNGWSGLGASVARHQLVVTGAAGALSVQGTWSYVGTASDATGASYKVYNGDRHTQLLLGDGRTLAGQSIELSAIAAGVGGFVINGQSALDMSGWCVSSAGDVNGDGLADVIVGAPFSDPAGGTDAGRSYVVFGKTSGSGIDLSAVAAGVGGFVLNGPVLNGKSGRSVSGAGDVNGDGLADLIVGTPESNVGGGSSYVVFGKTSGSAVDLTAVSGTVGFVINGRTLSPDTSVHAGVSVSGAGDVNGDGRADLIVGAYASDVSGKVDVGRSYVVFGKSSGTALELSTVANGGGGGFVLNGQGASDAAGWSVSGAGDVNGDGLADLIVGAQKADPYSGSNAGRSYVVFGKTSSTAIELSAVANGAGGFAINGQCSEDTSGFSVSQAGDVNGDGLADLIVGANCSDPAGRTEAGRSYVVFGKTSADAINLSAVAAGLGGFVINGENRADSSGESVSGAGDVNGDGLADLIVGAPAYDLDRGYDNGRSYVVFGKTSGVAINLSAVAAGLGGFAINGHCSTDLSGSSVSSAGDVNGDGLTDLIVGAKSYDPATGFSAGRSYVIFGSTSNTFMPSTLAKVGTAGNDTLSDDGMAQLVVGGEGQDVLTATAASVLRGGNGSDTVVINETMLTALQSPYGQAGNNGAFNASIDGGSGIDKIVLSGSGLTLDLTLVASQAASNPDGGSRIDSIEKIDLTGSGNNTLKLTARDVLDMGSANLFATNGRQQLLVMGNAGDTVDLAGGTGTTGWTKVSTAVTIEAAPYFEWKHTSLASVYVQSGVVVT